MEHLKGCSENTSFIHPHKVGSNYPPLPSITQLLTYQFVLFLVSVFFSPHPDAPLPCTWHHAGAESTSPPGSSLSVTFPCCRSHSLAPPRPALLARLHRASRTNLGLLHSSCRRAPSSHVLLHLLKMKNITLVRQRGRGALTDGFSLLHKYFCEALSKY